MLSIVPSKSGWQVKQGRGGVARFVRKIDAIAEARREVHQILREGGLAQIRVHGRDGRIQVEWTYGRDPRRWPG